MINLISQEGGISFLKPDNQSDATINHRRASIATWSAGHLYEGAGYDELRSRETLRRLKMRPSAMMATGTTGPTRPMSLEEFRKARKSPRHPHSGIEKPVAG